MTSTIIVSIEDRAVERHRRLQTGEWLMTEIRDGAIELASIGVTLPVETLFRDLERVRA